MLDNQVFCLVEEKFGQWVLEYNPVEQEPVPQRATFAVRSSQPRVSKAPATIWHERLAHCGPEVLEHLPTAVTGAKLVEGPSTSECEVCGLRDRKSVV